MHRVDVFAESDYIQEVIGLREPGDVGQQLEVRLGRQRPAVSEDEHDVDRPAGIQQS